jgi:hypothetical protein
MLLLLGLMDASIVNDLHHAMDNSAQELLPQSAQGLLSSILEARQKNEQGHHTREQDNVRQGAGGQERGKEVNPKP